MTPLRAKYIRDLTIRGRARRTQRAYTRYVSELARYYQRSPEQISYEEVTNWLYHLIKERRFAAWCAQRNLDELSRLQGEGDALAQLIDGDNTAVAQRHAVGVVSQVT
jgi:Phage integrase, N-terminal SAM-like domain